MRNSRIAFFVVVTGVAVALAIFLNLPRYNARCLAAPVDPPAAAALVAEMTASGEASHKRLGVYVDFAFIACYATLLIAGCNGAGQVFERQGAVAAARASQFMIGMVLATVLFDVAENVAMLKMLGGATDDLWLRIVKVTGRLKFTVPAAPVIYVIVGFARAMRRGGSLP
jgi:hypothetical protein